MQIFMMLCVVFLSIIGLSEIIHSLQLKLYKSKNRMNKIMLCILNDNTAELDLRYIAEQCKWLGKEFADEVFCINNVKSSDTYNLLNQLVIQNNFKLTTKDELVSLIESEK